MARGYDAGGTGKIYDSRGNDNESKGFWSKPSNVLTVVGTAVTGIVAVISAVTSFYTVSPNEQAVVRQFGAYNRTTSSGLHSRLPWPIEKVDKISTREQRRLEVGFVTTGRNKDGTFNYENHPETVTRTTKDENLAVVEFSVQYTVADPFSYMFNVRDPKTVLIDIAQASMRSSVSRHTIDEVLTTEKQAIQEEIREGMQALANAYGLGIRVNNVQAQEVRPPDAVKEAFDSVQQAREAKERLISEGLLYQNQHIPEAEARAFATEAQAKAYSAQVINDAKGAADRFNQLYAAYTAEPDITRRELYFREMKSVLSELELLIVDGEVPLNVFSNRGN